MTRRGGAKTWALLMVAVLVGAIVAWRMTQQRSHHGKELTIWCAAGMQKPVDQIIADYGRTYGVRVNVEYGGSGDLLNRLALAKQGDLFVAADESYILMAREKGMVDEGLPVAKMTPVILVQKGNPKGIKSLDDLTRNDVRLSLANPEQAAIGRTLRAYLKKTGKEKIETSARVMKPTVNDLANDLVLDASDAAVVWDATAAMYPKLDSVRDAGLDTLSERVTIGVMTTAKDPPAAFHLARYMTAADRGLMAFKASGFSVIDGDEWADVPEILFFSGGVNRPAVEKTVAAFEKREGCKINTVYNGCGILVSQMKSSARPDAYLACDVSFVPPVADIFDDPTPISETEIVIAVPKGNPKKITKLSDLGEMKLKLGVGNEGLSTLGDLTKRILEQQGIYNAVRANVAAEAPTADLLVSQLVLEGLDAAIVYRANLSQVKDKIDEVIMEGVPGRVAVQPFTAAKQSKHRQLVARLLERLKSAESRKVYESRGFTWRAAEADQ